VRDAIRPLGGVVLANAELNRKNDAELAPAKKALTVLRVSLR